MTLAELFVKLTADTSGFKRGTKEAEGSLDAFEKVAFGVAKKIGGFLTVIGIGKFALDAAEDIEKANIRIQRQTGATGEVLAGLEESWKNVYAQTAAGGEAVASVLSMIHQRSGLTGEALEKTTLGLLKLSKVMNEDVTSLAPVVTRLFGDWSVGAEDQARSMEYMRVVSQQTGTSIGELSERMVYAGAPLRQLGYDFNEAAALIGKFQAEGVNTQLVLGAMKAILGKFAKEGVEDTAAAWQDFILKVQSGQVTLADIAQTAGEFGVGRRAAVDLFRAIVEGRFEIDKTVTSFGNLARKSSEGSKSVSTAWTQLKHSVAVLVGPLLTWILDLSSHVVSAIVGAINEARRHTGRFVAEMAAYIGAGGPFGMMGGVGAAAAAAQAGTDYDLKHPAAAKPAPVVPPDVTGPAGRAISQEWEEAPGKVEQVKLKFESLRDVLSDIEKSKAAKAVEDEWMAAMEYVDYAIPELGIFHEAIQATLWDLPESAPAIEAFTDLNTLIESGTAQLENLRDIVMSIPPPPALVDTAADTEAKLHDTSSVLQGVIGDIGKVPEAMAPVKKQTNEIGREVQRAFDGMTRGMAKNILDWKGWGATLLGTVQSFAQGLLEIFLQRLFKPLQDLIANGLTGALGGALSGIGTSIGGLFGGLFGGGGEGGAAPVLAAGTNAGGALGSVFGKLGGGGGGAAGKLGGLAGLASPINMITGGISAVTDIIGLFSGRAQGMDIQRTEENTRFCRGYLLEVVNKLNEYLPKTKDILDYLWNPQATYLAQIAAAAGGAGGTVINFNNPVMSTKAMVDDVMNQVVARLRDEGVSI